MREENYDFNEGESSSVINEYVEEKIVHIDSDEDEANPEIDENEQRNQQINEYLDMNKEEYVNKEEYHNMDGMNSYEENQQEVENDHQNYATDADKNKKFQEASSPIEGTPSAVEDSPALLESPNALEAEGEMPEQEEVKHAGLQTNFLEAESKHILQYMLEGFEPEHAIVEIEESLLEKQYNEYGNSPIQENENEAYSTPSNDGQMYSQQMEDRTHLFQIANEVKKKDQSRKFVLWETNQMRNEWDEKLYPNHKRMVSQMKMEHHWNNDIQRARNTPKSKAQAYDYSNIEEQNIPVQKSQKWNANNESRVPLLSDHAVAKRRNMSKIFDSGDIFPSVAKRDHTMNRVFHQSMLQSQLHQDKFVKPVKTPLSHQSFGKVDSKKERFAGRPIFGGSAGGSHVQNGNAGRNRDFYSSSVF